LKDQQMGGGDDGDGNDGERVETMAAVAMPVMQ
jgi:hypothetical protein